MRSENPQAFPGKDDLFAESGSQFPASSMMEDSPPKGRGVKTELKVSGEVFLTFVRTWIQFEEQPKHRFSEDICMLQVSANT